MNANVRLLCLLSFALCFEICVLDALQEEPGETPAFADTDCGHVQGSWVTNGSAYVFRGIPYATPPVGQLRWKPPVPVSPHMGNCWNGTLVAQTFGNSCYQRDDLDVTKYKGSEDCLYINVWTPSLKPTFPLQVMFWIHGGFLTFGNGNWQDIGYAPTPKLAHDMNVVFVSLNYRLQAFGFMALDWLREKSPHNTSGNYGFMDQLVALQWVQRNIRNFGGDPNQVTVFGQSSGGTSIFALLGSPLSKGLFHKAWLLSASPVLNKTATDAFKDNEAFIRNTNCSDLDCLYSLSAHDVTASVPWDVYPYWAMADQNGLPSKGHFDGALAIVDGYVLKEAPFDAWSHGRGMDVPVMLGTTAQETDMFPVPATVSNWTWASNQYTDYVRSKLGTFSDDDTETALKLYPAGINTPELQYTTMTSDLRMTCPTHHLGQIAAASFTSPVYRYIAAYRPSRAVSFFKFDYLASYAAHGIDMYGFYGSMNTMMDNPAASDMAWESNMQKEMLSFVKNGRPASENWIPYPQSTAILSLNTTVVHAYHPNECNFWLSGGFFSYGWIN